MLVPGAVFERIVTVLPLAVMVYPLKEELATTQEANWLELILLPGDVTPVFMMLPPLTDTENPVGFTAVALLKAKLPAALTPDMADAAVRPLV